jgi:hypothetical protein
MTEERESGFGHSEREIAGRLSDERPVPAAGFRGALARRLATDDPGYGPRPKRLMLTVTACCSGGSLLIALGVLSAAGAL